MANYWGLSATRNVISAELILPVATGRGDKVNFSLVSLEQANDHYASQQGQLAPYLDN